MILLDNSAWSRMVAGQISTDRAQQIADWIESRELATCLPFMLEAGYSARSATDHRRLLETLSSLPYRYVSPMVERRALIAQTKLATRGHHRVAPNDLIIAACAEDADGGVLHYDSDFDVLAKRSGLKFESVWLAPAGSL